LVGVYEPNPKRVAQLKRDYGVTCFNSLSELLFEVDAVTVASPTAFHHTLARQALQAGVHVLVEKPITETLSQAKNLIDLSNREGRIFQVGFLERFRLLELLKGVDLGSVHFIEAHRLSPSLSRENGIDVVSDLMVHDLDLVLSLMKVEPDEVSAIGVPVITNHFDLANVRLEFANGAVANLNTSRVSATPIRKFRIFSSNGYLSLDFISNSVKLGFRTESKKIEKKVINNPSIDALQIQCSHFIDCIKRKERPVVNGESGLRVLKWAEIIKEKIEARSERVFLPPFKEASWNQEYF
jgi:predicted dehydrogenase